MFTLGRRRRGLRRRRRWSLRLTSASPRRASSCHSRCPPSTPRRIHVSHPVSHPQPPDAPLPRTRPRPGPTCPRGPARRGHRRPPGWRWSRSGCPPCPRRTRGAASWSTAAPLRSGPSPSRWLAHGGEGAGDGRVPRRRAVDCVSRGCPRRRWTATTTSSRGATHRRDGGVDLVLDVAGGPSRHGRGGPGPRLVSRRAIGLLGGSSGAGPVAHAVRDLTVRATTRARAPSPRRPRSVSGDPRVAVGPARFGPPGCLPASPPSPVPRPSTTPLSGGGVGRSPTASPMPTRAGGPTRLGVIVDGPTETSPPRVQWGPPPTR